jgi:hypothetical protein
VPIVIDQPTAGGQRPTEGGVCGLDGIGDLIGGFLGADT